MKDNSEIKTAEEILAKYIIEFPSTDNMSDEGIKRNVVPVENKAIDKINIALKYWKTFGGEKQKGIAYGLGLALEHIKKENTLPIGNVDEAAERKAAYDKFMFCKEFSNLGSTTKRKIFEYFEKEWYAPPVEGIEKSILAQKDLSIKISELRNIAQSQLKVEGIEEAAEKAIEKGLPLFTTDNSRRLKQNYVHLFKAGAKWYASQLKGDKK